MPDWVGGGPVWLKLMAGPAHHFCGLEPSSLHFVSLRLAPLPESAALRTAFSLRVLEGHPPGRSPGGVLLQPFHRPLRAGGQRFGLRADRLLGAAASQRLRYLRLCRPHGFNLSQRGGPGSAASRRVVFTLFFGDLSPKELPNRFGLGKGFGLCKERGAWLKGTSFGGLRFARLWIFDPRCLVIVRPSFSPGCS